MGVIPATSVFGITVNIVLNAARRSTFPVVPGALHAKVGLRSYAVFSTVYMEALVTRISPLVADVVRDCRGMIRVRDGWPRAIRFHSGTRWQCSRLRNTLSYGVTPSAYGLTAVVCFTEIPAGLCSGAFMVHRGTQTWRRLWGILEVAHVL